MATRNIQMNYYNGTNYDVLYPQSTPEQTGSLSINGGTVDGDIILTQETANINGCVNKGYVDNLIGSKMNKTLLKSYQLNLTLSNNQKTVINSIGIISNNLESYSCLIFNFKNIQFSMSRDAEISLTFNDTGSSIEGHSPIFFKVNNNLTLDADNFCVLWPFISFIKNRNTELEAKIALSNSTADNVRYAYFPLNQSVYIGLINQDNPPYGTHYFKATMEIYGVK